MLDAKHIIGAVAAFAGVALAGTLALAWPSYRQVLSINREIADLRVRTEMLDSITAEVEILEARLHQAQRKVNNELKVISDSPDLADLMRRLTLTVDHDTVVDQAFTAGTPFPIAVPGLGSAGADSKDAAPAERAMAMPVTIELAGTFESLFAVLTAAESLDRLVRVGMLRVTCDRSERNNVRNQPVLTASVGLEAVFVERGGGRR